jgi:hypothetical protein
MFSTNRKRRFEKTILLLLHGVTRENPHFENWLNRLNTQTAEILYPPLYQEEQVLDKIFHNSSILLHRVTKA